MRKRFIYKITCIKNNRIYIGSAYDVQKRFKRHMKGRDTHPDMFLDVQKYGADSFNVEVLQTIKNGDGWTDGHLISNLREKHWINYYSNNYPDLIYNLFDKPNWKPASDARCRKISEAKCGKKHSPETIKKMSEALSGEKNPMFGRTGDQSPIYGKGKKYIITFGFEPDIYIQLTGRETGGAFRTGLHTKQDVTNITTGRLTGITFTRKE